MLLAVMQSSMIQDLYKHDFLSIRLKDNKENEYNLKQEFSSILKKTCMNSLYGLNFKAKGVDMVHFFGLVDIVLNPLLTNYANTILCLSYAFSTQNGVFCTNKINVGIKATLMLYR